MLAISQQCSISAWRRREQRQIISSTRLDLLRLVHQFLNPGHAKPGSHQQRGLFQEGDRLHWILFFAHRQGVGLEKGLLDTEALHCKNDT